MLACFLPVTDARISVSGDEGKMAENCIMEDPSDMACGTLMILDLIYNA